MLDALTDKEVLPQCTNVIAQGKWSEVLQHGIADAVIIEEHFATLLQFGPDITGECGQTEYDETLLEQVYVFLDGLRVSPYRLSQFVITHLTAHLQGQSHQEFLK